MQEILGIGDATIDHSMLFAQNCMELAGKSLARQESTPGDHYWASYDIGSIVTIKYSSFNGIDHFKTSVVDSFIGDRHIVYLRDVFETKMHSKLIDPIGHKIDVFGFINIEKDPNWLIRSYEYSSFLPRDVAFLQEQAKIMLKKVNPGLRINSLLKQAQGQKPFGPIYAFLT